jgi:DNA-binding response OmpR family regulator
MAGNSNPNLRIAAFTPVFTENLQSPARIAPRLLMRVLVVEDKRSLAGHLGRALEGEGYSVTLAYDGEEALRLGKTGAYDVMLLDVMLPRMDGFTVIRKLREVQMRAQAIIVSARDSMQDVVNGLDAGADDYLTKPFALDVLLAKVRAAARRVPVRAPQTLQFEDLVFRPQQFELQRGERVASLTRTECALLGVLVRRARSVVPHAALIEEGWSGDADVSYDSLYVLIRALRLKITHPGEIELLHTVRGVGYSLRSETC